MLDVEADENSDLEDSSMARVSTLDEGRMRKYYRVSAMRRLILTE
jgi:hypothetical protein